MSSNTIQFHTFKQGDNTAEVYELVTGQWCLKQFMDGELINHNVISEQSARAFMEKYKNIRA